MSREMRDIRTDDHRACTTTCCCRTTARCSSARSSDGAADERLTRPNRKPCHTWPGRRRRSRARTPASQGVAMAWYVTSPCRLLPLRALHVTPLQLSVPTSALTTVYGLVKLGRSEVRRGSPSAGSGAGLGQAPADDLRPRPIRPPGPASAVSSSSASGSPQQEQVSAGVGVLSAALVDELHGRSIAAVRPAVAPGHHREQRRREVAALLGQHVVVADGVAPGRPAARGSRPRPARRAAPPARCARPRGRAGCRRSASRRGPRRAGSAASSAPRPRRPCARSSSESRRSPSCSCAAAYISCKSKPTLVRSVSICNPLARRRQTCRWYT